MRFFVLQALPGPCGGPKFHGRPPPAVPGTISYPEDKEDFIEFVPFIKQPRQIKTLLFGGSEGVL
jgi:hypothetical protein